MTLTIQAEILSEDESHMVIKIKSGFGDPVITIAKEFVVESTKP